MSLFGDEAETPSTRPKASLFDEGNAKTSAAGGSSMFGDDAMAETHDSDSPWGFTPKKSAGRGGSLVKTLLADADVPDGYVDVFDRLQAGGGKVEAAECQKLLGEAGIAQGDREQAWRIVSGEGSSDLGRGEFNVLLALVGLAQEGEELSLDAVDERRRNLPMPSLPALASLKKGEEPPAAPRQSQARGGAGQETTTASVQQNGHARKTSFGAGFGENDPWASPDLHKGHGHLNGLAGSGPQRTTSSFTTGAASTTAGGTYGNGQAGQGDEGEASSWGSTPHFGGAGGGNEGFGGTGSGAGGGFGDDPNTPSTPRRPAAPRNTVSKGAEEVVTVQILDGKEGMFMFQHRNYEVASVRRNSKVVRRYSDFVWLLDCLHKRYPFRQLPLLPPKRVAINGNHIAADQTFLEKRRRGLARFCNALVRHPVLREEQLVVMFLTVPTVNSPFPPPSPKASQTTPLTTSFPGTNRLAQTSHHKRARRIRLETPSPTPRRQPAPQPLGNPPHRARRRPPFRRPLHQPLQPRGAPLQTPRSARSRKLPLRSQPPQPHRMHCRCLRPRRS